MTFELQMTTIFSDVQTFFNNSNNHEGSSTKSTVVVTNGHGDNRHDECVKGGTTIFSSHLIMNVVCLEHPNQHNSDTVICRNDQPKRL